MILNKGFQKKKEESTTPNSLLMVRMVTSYSIFLLVILVLSIAMYITTSRNVRTQFREQNKAMLKSSVQLLDKDINIMEVFCRQLLQDNDFIRLSDTPGPSHKDFFVQGYSTRQNLAANIYPDTLLPIYEYFIHFEHSKYVLSSSHFAERSLFYHGTRRYPAELYDSWITFLENEDYYNTLISLDDYTLAPNQHYYMYVMDLSDLSPKHSIDAAACFVLDSAKMGELFEGIEYYESGYLLMTDNTGKVLFAMSDQTDPFDASGYDADILRNLRYTNDYAEITIDGEKMLVTKQGSDSTNWYYYLVQPAHASQLAFQSYQKIFMLAILLALVIGGWMIVVFSRRNVRPIVALGQELHEAVETQNQLQEVVEKQKPIICNSYVSQLMRGTISSEEEMEYIQDYLDLRGDSLAFNVLYAVTYNNESDNDATPVNSAENERMFAIVLDAMKQYLGEPLLRYSPTDRTYAILLACQAEEADSLVMKMQETVLRLHEYLLEQHSIWFFAGIGRNTDSLMNVWECYQQAQEAINYATKNYFFLPYEIIKKNSNVFYYPPELSTKLIHFITSGNKPQVLELFNLIHQENIEERSLPVHLLKFLLSDIRNTLLKARFSAPEGTDQTVLDSLDAKFNEHLSFKLCEDIAMQLCSIFQIEHEDLSLSAAIEKYILENYKDPSLGLNKISDEFQISESYFSHMFKEKTGVNFSVYLENIRMSEAARLVRETDTNLSELYIIVGYNNINTFRRAFKKNFGVTPSNMRDNAISTH